VWGFKSFGLRIWYAVTMAKDDVQETQLQCIERVHEGTNKPALSDICFLLSMTRCGEVVGFGVEGGWFGCSASIGLGDRVVPQTSDSRVDDDIAAAPLAFISIAKLESIDDIFV
jgi:hypothetical protein